MNQQTLSEAEISQFKGLLQALQQAGGKVLVKIGEAGEQFEFEHVVNATGSYIVAHPYKSAYFAVSTAVFVFPSLTTAPFFALLGLGRLGPVAGILIALPSRVDR